MTNHETGERLVREAQRIFERDLKAAWTEGDYNLVIRRAQEVVELSLKGALSDVGSVFVEQMQRKGGQLPDTTLFEIQRISAWLSEAPAPAFYLDRVYGETDASRALVEAEYILGEVKMVNAFSSMIRLSETLAGST